MDWWHEFVQSPWGPATLLPYEPGPLLLLAAVVAPVALLSAHRLIRESQSGLLATVVGGTLAVWLLWATLSQLGRPLLNGPIAHTASFIVIPALFTGAVQRFLLRSTRWWSWLAVVPTYLVAWVLVMNAAMVVWLRL